MKTKIEIKGKIKQPKHNEEFKLIVDFDYGESLTFFFNTEEETLSYINMYEEYAKNLGKNWNSWCNPEANTLAPLVTKYFEIEDDNAINDFLCDIWSRDQEYHLEPFARYENFKLTYYDKDGIERNTSVN